MLRAENLSSPEAIQAELDVYNHLMPTDSSLSATLFIEVPPEADPRVELDRLIGLDEHVAIHIGQHQLRAEFEAGRSTQDRISAVQYIRFPLPESAKQALAEAGTRVALVIDHPEYAHETVCDDATRTSLAADYVP